MNITKIILSQPKSSPYFDILTQKIDFKPQAIIVKVLAFSIDPVMRVWLAGAKTNFRQVKQGDIFNCFGVGKVIKSKDESYAEGSYIFGNTGTTNFFQLDQSKQRECFCIDGKLVQQFGPQKYIYLINNGLAAFAGLQIMQVKKGENVVVSIAAGATGLLLCHLLKKREANIIALSSPSKSKYLQQYTKHIIDYRDQAKMIDFLQKNPFSKYFDGVGQAQLDIILDLIQNNGIVALCGAIANYLNPKQAGIRNLAQIIFKRIKIQGFQFAHLFPRTNQIFQQFKDAELYIETISLKQFPHFFQQLFKSGGSIVGKIVVNPHL